MKTGAAVAASTSHDPKLVGRAITSDAPAS
jgi:hypothetical protein